MTPSFPIGSLYSNALCGLDFDGTGTYTAEGVQGTYTTEGITKLCEGLKGSAVTSLKCAAPPSVRFRDNAH